jgi:hypothetical protein
MATGPLLLSCPPPSTPKQCMPLTTHINLQQQPGRTTLSTPLAASSVHGSAGLEDLQEALDRESSHSFPAVLRPPPGSSLISGAQPLPPAPPHPPVQPRKPHRAPEDGKAASRPLSVEVRPWQGSLCGWLPAGCRPPPRSIARPSSRATGRRPPGVCTGGAGSRIRAAGTAAGEGEDTRHVPVSGKRRPRMHT